MGRRSHSQTLHLWANGDYVGRWTVNANGDSELAYDARWRENFIARVPAVIDKVRAELPAGFSEMVADKILDGVLASARALERMSPV